MTNYPGTVSALSELSSFLETNDWKQQLSEVRQLFYEQLQSSNTVTKDLHQAINQTLLQNSKHLKSVLDELCVNMKSQLNHSQYALDIFAQALEYYKNHPIEKPDIPFFDFSDTSSDDYVLVNESLVKECDITESVTVSVGNNRVKMKTSDFIQLLILIFTALSFTVTFIAGRLDAASEAKTSNPKINIEQERNELMQEQNQMLYEFLSSVDASESSKTEAIEDLKESVLNLHSDFLELSESVPSHSDVPLTQDSVPSSHKSDSNPALETRNSNLE